MALVEKYHVVAAVRPVNASAVIKEGQIVALNADAEVVLQSGDAPRAYGIAGDTKSTSASSMPGVGVGFQNRVSDYFDETKASVSMTVYHSGGEFATDQFASNVSDSNVGDLLYARDGVLDDQDQNGETNAAPVAMLTQGAGPYMSGVPGVDVPGYNDIALSGENDEYIEFKLLI